ncbi:hypothetical protein NDU88_003296 [Pleurodeles waltl]|uniref:Uncharacterized protein n=1 Tax=Pleurodeles waltl TaxID=8319 RepID=A0AAV7VDL4_PLEWA|nr:hypothetical protein NDU88_003296 [Pleurodeles waltl]
MWDICAGYMKRKAGLLLAWLVCSHTARTPISGITLSDGSLVHDPLSINAVFREYYLALYTHPEILLLDTLGDLQLKTLNGENAVLLGAGVAEDEVKLAISDLATGVFCGKELSAGSLYSGREVRVERDYIVMVLQWTFSQAKRRAVSLSR